jgi:uncharacterized protein (TIGR03905 family)
MKAREFMYSYITKGVCSKRIVFDIIDNKISNVSFTGGCNGNLQGLSNLVEGMSVEDTINKLTGIKCGGNDTSCPDQLATALRSVVQAMQEKLEKSKEV